MAKENKDGSSPVMPPLDNPIRGESLEKIAEESRLVPDPKGQARTHYETHDKPEAPLEIDLGNLADFAKENEWYPVKLENLVDKSGDVPAQLRSLGYDMYDGGVWYNPDTNIVVSNYKSDVVKQATADWLSGVNRKYRK